MTRSRDPVIFVSLVHQSNMHMTPFLVCFLVISSAAAFGRQPSERSRPEAVTEKIKITYSGKEVTARKLTVSSELPMPVDSAWNQVITSALLEFVTRGKMRFKPSGGAFPEIWRQGDTVTTRMRAYGFIPFGGLHTLYFDKIDEDEKVIETKEWNRTVKVWNHRITLREIDKDRTRYEDEIIIYAGALTGPVTSFAKGFYKHRQRRWQLVAQGLGPAAPDFDEGAVAGD